MNRVKKPKKKKTSSRSSRNASGGSFESSAIALGYSYTSVPSNRQRGSHGGNNELSEGSELIEDILQKIKYSRHEGDGSEKHSDPFAEDVETSCDTTSPELEGQISPLKTESSCGLHDPHYDEGAKQMEQLTKSINDFEDDDVYLRRNCSMGRLTDSASATLPTSAESSSKTTPSAPPTDTTPKPTEKQSLYVTGQPSSPATSPHRLNFSSANGLLANGHGGGTSEEHVSMAPTSHPKLNGSVYPNGMSEVLMEHPNELETMFPPGTRLEALLQMGSHSSINSLTHQMAQLQQIPTMGPPTNPLQNIFALTHHQAVMQGQPILGNVSNLSSHPRMHLNALLAQDPTFRGMHLEPMRNGREDYRKHKDDVYDAACFYMRPTNDLDRFLTEVTPMLHLDPNLDLQEAQDQLVLVTFNIPSQS